MNRLIRIAGLCFGLLMFCAMPLLAQTAVFINEIHYDNASTDEGEAIEIAGPAGTDLTGWSIVLYNGNGGADYDTVSLSGTIPDDGSGFGFVTEFISGIQNGAPDGIVLFDGVNVVQFLSYEGSFTAVGGVADGVTSTDIGVSESSSTPVGNSMQLTGTGTIYEDFIWASELGNTFSAVNAGQVFDAGANSSPIVTIDTPADGFTAEEGTVIDFSATATDAEDGDLSSSVEWTSSLDGSLGTGADIMSTLTEGTHMITASVTDSELATGIAEITVSITPVGGVQTAVFINEIHYDNSGTDEGEAIEIAGPAGSDLTGWSIVLYNGNGGAEYDTISLAGTIPDDGTGFGFVTEFISGIQNGAPDGIVLFNGTEVVQFLSYEGAFTAVGGVADGLTSTDIGVSESSSTPAGNSLQLTGTGSIYEDFSWASDAPETFDFVNTGQTFEAVPLAFINEIHYDNTGGDEDEGVEIAGRAGTDLTGWSIVLYNGNGGAAYNTVDLSGSIPDDGSGFGFVTEFISGIQNGAPDGIVLYNGSEVVQFLSYEGSFTAVGGVADGLTSTDIGVSESSSTPVGNSLQLTGTGTRADDFIWAADAPNTFGLVNTGQEFGEDSGIMVKEIFEIQGAGLESPFADTVVRSENNVVTVVGPEGFFMQTPLDRVDGDINTSDGIYVFTESAPEVSVGDLVDVEGQVIEFFDFTEFSNGPTVTVVGSGGALPAPIVFDENVPSSDQPQDENAYERYEGMLITIPNGLVSGPSQSFGSDPEAEAYIVANGMQPFREPGILFPGIDGLPVWDGNPEVFELDPDKLGLENVLFTRGSSFSATGALGFEFGGYELWASELTVSNLADLPVSVRAPEESEGTIGSLNLLRLDISDSDAETKIAKLSAYIRTVLLSPDILAVQEVEDIATLSELATKINADDSGLNYEAYLIEGNDVGGIDVGYLVNANTVQVNQITQLAADETLTVDGSLLHDRPPLLLEADFLVFGVPAFAVEVLAVHNRSLSGIDDTGSNGDRVRTKRLEQAQSIARIVQDRQTANPDVNLTVIGDFNAFEFSDGYVDVIGEISGNANPDDNLLSGEDLVEPDLTNQVLSLPAEERYSFIFNGTAQVLDHALTSSGFNPSITGFAFGRGNVGAPEVFEDDVTTALVASDHDGLVMYVQLQDVFPATAVLAAEKSIYLDRSSAVESGDILVATDAEGNALGGEYELFIDRRATTPSGFQVKADGISVFPDAVINGDVTYNTLDNFGTINGTETSPLELPVFDAPPFPAVTPGTENVSVMRNQTTSLDAGAYGQVVLRRGSTLILTGGEYHIQSLTVLTGAEVRFGDSIDLRIKGRLTADRGMMIGPVDGTSLEASDFIVYVEGMNGETGGLNETPAAVSFGGETNVHANLYAPNGSIVFDGNSLAEGSFIAKDINVGRNTTVVLNSYWATIPFQPVAEIASETGDVKDRIAAEVPETFALGQNYPNPFNPMTSIPFSLPEASHVRLVVYDMLGRVVDTVVDGELSAGYHNATFDATAYPSGTYIYRIEAGGFTAIQKMVLVK